MDFEDGIELNDGNGEVGSGLNWILVMGLSGNCGWSFIVAGCGVK